MCGIVGMYNLNRRPVDPSLVSHMMAFQRHRGPDDDGLRLFTMQGVAPSSVEVDSSERNNPGAFEGALGFNRLSILDLTANGHQPMCNKTETVILALNGEIYNAFDFKDELIANGYDFRSRSDTEVLLYLYEHFGLQGMLDRINGMFAIVICDLAKRKVHLVRDRFGIKPLYYYVRGPSILFSSEVKSFLACPDFRPELDIENLDEFLLFRYCAEDRHLLKGVHPLLPAHVMTLDSEGLSVLPYWHFSDPDPSYTPSANDVAARIEQSLRASVKRQLVSDVRLGCQLSGGIDSSLVAMMASEEAGDRLHAISVILEDPRFSEEPFMDHVHDQIHIDCHKFLLDERFFSEHLLHATWFLDQPLNHPNSLGIFLLAKQARRWMTVLLSGEGADELLGSYSRHALAHGRFRSLARIASPWVQRLPQAINRRFASRFGRDPDLGKVDWFIANSAFMPFDFLRGLRPTSSPFGEVRRRRSIFDEKSPDFAKSCLKYDLRTYLVDLLIRQDKMTMAHSIENRVPFLDNEMIDSWQALPSSYLVKPAIVRIAHATKIPLKLLAEKYFGHQFAYRKKQGFGLPLKTFFGTSTFVALMEDLVLPGLRRRGIIHAQTVEAWWRTLSSLTYAEVESLWICIAFELWAHLFLDGAGMQRFAN